MSEPPPVDVIGNVIGNFGKWQLRTILIIFLCKIPTSWFMAVIIYTAPVPKIGGYWCRLPNDLEMDNYDNWVKIAHPIVKDKIDYCHVYKDVMDNPYTYLQFDDNGTYLTNVPLQRNDTVPCEDFYFDSEFHSLIAQFNLVCSKSILLPVSQCFHILGLLIGGIIAFMLLKVMSPRHVMVTGMISQMMCGVCTGMVKTYILHVIFRCLSASTCALMYTSGSNILQDMTGGRPKILTTIVFELFWSIGLILLPAIAMFFTTYSHLYIAISMPTVILLFLHRLIPDSARWYIRRGNVKEAKKIILHGGATNKNDIPEDIDNLLRLQADACMREPPPAPWLALWDGNPRKRYMLAVFYAWAVYILLFNSMVLGIRAFGQDYVYINTVVVAISEIFGVFVGMYLILYTRRRWLWTGLISIGTGSLAFLAWLIPDTMKENHIVACEMVPTLAIKLATSSSLSILTTCTADLVSADKKKILMLSAGVWARGWFLWAPFVNSTKKWGTLVPLSIFAILSIFGGCLTSVVNHSHHKNHKKQQQTINLKHIMNSNGIDNPGIWTSKAKD